ncbi:MAG: hypothetical protein APU95_02920 [Hadesarchaea archaeon YNP_N21]|nr:MAG: hypothetical protein APU95_02920 [Hadesarchaea archaeon YNP_N21]
MAERRARAYLMEAELTFESAEAVFERAKLTGKRLWSKVVKEAYDAMEGCAAAALALKGVGVPRYHPAQRSQALSPNLD